MSWGFLRSIHFALQDDYVLLPLSLAGAVILCSQGVIQNFHPYQTVATVEGKTQTVAQGPVASQEPIKLMSSDGGGFFNRMSRWFRK